MFLKRCVTGKIHLIKTYLIFPYSLFIILFLSCCSTIEAGFESLTQSFSESEEVEAPLVESETNTAMLSTRIILESQTEIELEEEKQNQPEISTFRFYFTDNINFLKIYDKRDLNDMKIYDLNKLERDIRREV